MGSTDFRKIAKKMRAELHIRLSSKLGTTSIEEKYSKFLRGSFRLQTHEMAPETFGMDILAYSLYLTEAACESVLQSSRTLEEKIEMFSYLVELSAREFYVDKHENTIVHLTAAKENGYFFTPITIANKLFENSLESKRQVKKILDPACGAGLLLATVLINKNDVDELIGIEIDSFTAYMARKLLSFTSKQVKSSAQIQIIEADSLQKLAEFSKEGKAFDFIIMNPPYGKLKFLSNSLSEKQSLCIGENNHKIIIKNEKTSRIDAKKEKISRLIKEKGIIQGIPEYSRFFIFLSSKLVSEGGILSVISPSAWLGDHQSSSLRKYLLSNNNIFQVTFINERARFFETVNQPTSIVGMRAGESTKVISILRNVDGIDDFNKEPTDILIQDIIHLFPNDYRIPQIDRKMIRILRKITDNGKVGNTEGLVNLRGEADITFHKQHFSQTKTTTRLIRGDHISNFILNEGERSNKIGYINRSEFEKEISGREKITYVDNWRIACPQCSYLKKQNRLEFALIPPGCILSNSTNFLTFRDINPHNIDRLYFLLAVLNSSIAEWFFRVFSTNNHVGNYELDAIPLPSIPDTAKKKLVSLVKKSIAVSSEKAYFSELCCEIDSEVAKWYNLDVNEYYSILKDLDRDHKDQCVNIFLGHQIPTLSQKDMEIIKSIPQGGNWQNIPKSIQSRRLDQIRQMSEERGLVRTSYYGRLRPEQPAYTIATYFNRPGNGTNIHPFEDRTLTLREGARLQSFPDTFTFFGSENEIRIQIGNAVPPLLGFALGKVFPKETCAELFSGAGGLSYGFVQAGHEVLVAQEIDKSASLTFMRNHRNTKIVVGDITEITVQKQLIETVKKSLKGRRLGILMGGPPCQGFSTAGWRLNKDARNSLVKYFFQFAHEFKPKYIVIENVPGILSMQNGKVIDSIKKTLTQLGYHYNPEPWILKAEQYGVPQMRRRVVIIAAAEGYELPNMPIPTFTECKGRREFKKKMNTEGPYPITVEQAFVGLPELQPNKTTNSINQNYYLLMSGAISFEEFIALSTRKDYAMSLTQFC